MNLSASQVSKFLRCKRAYALEYVENQKPPTSPKQQFGKDVHAQLERWLRYGKKPDDSPEGLTAKQGIRNKWLPTPSSNLLVEHKFEIPWFEDVYMIGYIDCAEPVEIPVMIDHKSTSNLAWAMTVGQLAKDPQALIYSLWGALEYRVSRVKARWVYYSASNPKSGTRKPTGALPVEVEFKVNEEPYINQIRELIEVTRQMIRIRKDGILGKNCPASPGMCKSYGGCWHLGKGCTLSPNETIEGYF